MFKVSKRKEKSNFSISVYIHQKHCQPVVDQVGPERTENFRGRNNSSRSPLLPQTVLQLEHRIEPYFVGEDGEKGRYKQSCSSKHQERKWLNGGKGSMS